MIHNTKNLKDKIDHILEQNKRYQQQIPLNFVKNLRQSSNTNNQQKPITAVTNKSLEDRKKQLLINTSFQRRTRSGNSWTGDNTQPRLRISTTPSNSSSRNNNNNNYSNKENIFRKCEFLSTKNSSVKSNKKKKIDYNFNMTSGLIQLKNNSNAQKMAIEKVQQNQQAQQQNGKSPIDNLKILSITKHNDNDNQLNYSKEASTLNSSNFINNSNLTALNPLMQNCNISNISSANNKWPDTVQSINQTNQPNHLNQTTCSTQSTIVKNNQDNLRLNQTMNITTQFMNTNSPSSAALNNNNNNINNNNNNNNNNNIQNKGSVQSEIVNQLIKIIEQDKKNSAKQYQQFQSQQHQSSLERIRKRESFSLQMRQQSQQIDLATTSKRGSNFGLLDSNNNYQHSEEENAFRVRELQTKYHLRDAMLRQEIQKLQSENTQLKTTNQQLDEEVNRYRNIRTMENKYIKKMEQELIEEKQKYQISFKKYSPEDCVSNNNSAANINGNQPRVNSSKVTQHNIILNNQIQLKSVPITPQNAFQIAKQQERAIQALSEKVSELMNEKEYLEQILKNLLLKTEMDKQQNFDSLSFEISQQKPSYLNTSFSENSCFAPFKISTSNASYPNISSNIQINPNQSSQKHQTPALNSISQISNCQKQISQIKEEIMEESSRVNKTSQMSSQQQQQSCQQQQQQQQQLQQTCYQPQLQQDQENENQQLQQQQQRDNINILNKILEKNKIQGVQNNYPSKLNSRTSESPRQNQKKQQKDYPPQAPSSLNSVKRYSNKKILDSSEKNSARNSIDGFIFGPPKSAHLCSYEEQLMNQQQQNNRVIFIDNDLENDNDQIEEKEDFYWDQNHDEFIINEIQLKNLIEDYKRRAQNIDLI